MAIMARARKLKGIILPKANALEAAVVNNLEVYGMESLAEVIDFSPATRIPRPRW